MIGDLLRRVPIRVRLTLAFAAVMVVLFGGLALLLHERFSASLDAGIDRALHTRAADLATLVLGGAGDRLDQHPPLPESGGAFAQILSTGDTVVDSTPGHGARALLTESEVQRALHTRVSIDRRDDARLLAQPLPAKTPAVLVVGASLSQRDRALRTLSEMLFIGGPVLLLLTCLAGYLLTAGALAPVEGMRRRAARISGAGRGDRLPVPEAHDELHRLGETLNEMLSRLEEGMVRERTFVANAGHELRTPLAILKLEIELALSGDPSHRDLREALRSSAEEVERLEKLAQDLLVIARADQGRLPVDKRPVEIEGVLRGITERIANAARDRGRPVTARGGDGIVVAADTERLEQALTNMVSNALVHGEGPVEVVARTANGAVELHVLDRGRGFDADFLPEAFERFSRADPARSRGGAGLGLAIVQAVAEAHGGCAGAVNRDGGGADVWVSLPASQAPLRSREL
jgi:two-component system OmpR family sensor kinase